MEKKYIYAGAAILSIGGFVFYRKMKKSAAPAPSQESASTDALNFSTPAMMYAPAGGGTMGMSSADTSGTANAPSVSAVTGATTGAGLADIIGSFAKTQAGAQTNAADVAALSSIKLTPGQTASVSHTADGSSVTVSKAPTAVMSKTEILDALHKQAYADGMDDSKYTASYVRAAADKLNITTDQVAGAMGITTAQMNQWIAAH